MKWYILNQSQRILRVNMLIMSCLNNEIEIRWARVQEVEQSPMLCQEVILRIYRYSQKHLNLKKPKKSLKMN